MRRALSSVYGLMHSSDLLMPFLLVFFNCTYEQVVYRIDKCDNHSSDYADM
jgi:hypothetical protein